MESPPKVELSQRMIQAGVNTLRRMMRGDTLILDYKAETLQMIVREIALSMLKERDK